jgi:uncharacterized protein with ATP-grasp and redox domains
MNTINDQQHQEILDLLQQLVSPIKFEDSIKTALKINNLKEMPESLFIKVQKRLKDLIEFHDPLEQARKKEKENEMTYLSLVIEMGQEKKESKPFNPFKD